jgi:hypothetical protein
MNGNERIGRSVAEIPNFDFRRGTMRKQTIGTIALIFFVVPLLFSQKPREHRIASLVFNAGIAGDCLVNVSAAKERPSEPPNQVLAISCQGKQILRYATQDALIDLSLNYPHDDRVFARWEGGSHVRLTVFRVAEHQAVGSVVFDKQLEGAPDVINTPDALLVHKGKRWIDGQAFSLPTSTDVYRWVGDKYVLNESWKWNENMRFEERFCILDTKNLSCPVTSTPLN